MLSDMSKMSGRLELRSDEDFLKKLDGWRREQPALPSRSKALRQIVEAALDSDNVLLPARLCDGIDDWRTKHRVWSRASAIEFLVRSGKAATESSSTKPWTRFSDIDAEGYREIEQFLTNLDNKEVALDVINTINDVLDKIPEWVLENVLFVIDSDGMLTLAIDPFWDTLGEVSDAWRIELEALIDGPNVRVAKGFSAW